MSINSEIARIKINIENAYKAAEEKGGTIPSEKTVENLPSTIESIHGAETYAFVIANYPTGKVCKCVCGSVTLVAEDTSGSYVFSIPSSGNWVLSAGNSSYTAIVYEEGQSLTVNLSETIPKLNSKPVYMQIKSGGLSAIDSQAQFANTTISQGTTPKESCILSVNLDVNGNGDIAGYVYETSVEHYYELIISGNGADKIYCNENSTRAFAYLANNCDESNGYISGIEMLDMSYVTKADYMFANISLGDFTFPYMSFPAMTQCYFMFSKISADNLTVTGMYAPNLKSTTYMFWYSNITLNLDISGICTTDITNMQYMFAEGEFGNLDLNGLDTSSVNSFSSMFENASVGALKINRWNTSAGQNFRYMFRGFDGNGMPINVSSWNMSGATICEYMFNNTANVSAVYISNKFTSCTYFTGMFGGSSCSISTVFSNTDFTTLDSVTSQYPFDGNNNFSATTIGDGALKLKINGGQITYHEPIDD